VDTISPWVALGGGLLSLLSPCVLPMIPVYLAVLAGPAVAGEGQHKRRLTIFKRSLLFVAGFALVFVLMGAGAGWVGDLINSHLLLVRRIAGSLMILFGLFMLASNWVSWLNYEKRLSAGTNLATGYLSSFLIGLLFALAWTPCVGPVLGGILTLAFNSQSIWQGAALLGIYSLGLGLPFLAIGLAFDSLRPILLRLKRYSAYVYIAGGLLLIATGILIWLNKLNWYS
jgi:cytochrome c-type biogenesis protein